MLPIGASLIWGDGTRYPSRGLWWSYDKYAPIDWGLHVFRERAQSGSAMTGPGDSNQATSERTPGR